MRLLVIEDDPDLNRQLATALTDAGYVVDRAFDGEEGHYLGETEPYDAVILDIGLPKMDGISVLESWRRAGRAMPVLMLTARDRWSDKVQGFDAGADDYVGKPFDLDELAARLRAVRRRLLGRSAPALRHGGVTLDPQSRLAWREEGDLPLSRREFAILEALMERPAQVLSRSQLEERLYGWQEEIGSNAVEVHIHYLRAKLGAGFIRTVRGVGYTLQ